MTTGHGVFDADAHVIEPDDLYFGGLDPAYRHRVQVDEAIGDHHGRLLPLLDGVRSYGGSAWMEEVLRTGQGRQILVDRFGSIAERGFDPGATVEALDIQGIDIAALFPSFSLHVPFTRGIAPDLAAALARAYNRWIGEHCRAGGGRLLAVAVAPLHDPHAAVDETRVAVEDHGARAVMVRPNPIMGRPLHHPDHDRFFSLIEDLDVPLVVHEGRGGQADFAGDRFDTWYASHAVSHPFEMMLAFTGLAVEGVFDRHPRLRVGLLEAGTGWLTWWLDRLDEHHHMFGGNERAGLRHKPSEYFAEHCVISSDSDDAYVNQTIDTVGADHVTWSSDFPHLEAKWPDGVDVFLRSAGLDAATAEQVLWQTPCRFYAVDPSTPTRGAHP